MKILLLSYACEPGQGSEAGISWRWITGLTRDHEVLVVAHPRGRAAIERHLAEHPNPNLRFTYVEIPHFLDPWQQEVGEKRIHTKYVLWQFWMYAAARKLVRQEHFDLVHHISWITMTGPTLGWALGRPFIWGPLGSGQTAPLQMRRHLGTRGWIREAIRNLQVKAVRANPLSLMAARRSVAAIATNLETVDALQRLGARYIPFIYCSAVDDHWIPASFPERPERETPVIAWLGRLEPRKSPALAIEAFARARAEQPCELWMIGDGTLMDEMQALTNRLGVADCVRFWGKVAHDDVPQRLLESDLFLFTSLRDSCTAVVLEAMALGLPAVSIDHQGMRILPDETVLKVPVTDPDRIVDDLALAMSRLVQSPDERRQRGIVAWNHIRDEHLWSHRFQSMRDVYTTALARHHATEEPLAYERPR